MDLIKQQCSARSLGPANQLMNTLVMTLVAMHCNISTPDMYPDDFGEEAVKNGLTGKTFDFIVVGAGTAGSVVAKRLAENSDFRVLLLEAGGDPPMETEIPGLTATTQFTNYDWQYETTSNGLSCLAMKDESCIWSAGKMMGGSSALGSMSYLRGNAKDYDGWEDEGNPTWGWRDVIPYFKKSQNFNGENRYGVYGTDGPLNIEPFSSSKHDQYMILEASAELGYRQVDDFVEGQYLGFGFVYGTLENGRRESTAKAYLRKEPSNLHVIKNAFVEKIEFDDDLKVESVKFSINGTHNLEAKVSKEIILSAGAIGSSKILMLSGIGQQTQLRGAELPTLVDLPVGENLQDHVAVVLFLKCQKTYYLSDEMHLLDSIYNQWIHRSGPLGNTALDIAGFISTKRSSRYPDVQFQFTPVTNLTYTTYGFKSNIKDSLEKQVSSKDRVLRVTVSLLRPRSRGHVRIESSDIKKPPIVIPNSFQKDTDLKTIVRGIKELFDFERTKTFERMHARFVRLELPACQYLRYKSMPYWECYVKQMTGSLYHYAGTTKMGPLTDHSAVVDPELKVKGVNGLRVIDASIIPSLPSGDIIAPTIMIAEKGAEFIKNMWKKI